MLKRTFLPLAAALCLTLAAACGPSFRQVQVRYVTEAELLQAEAAAKSLQGGEIEIANGYLAKAKAASNQKESADYADLAAAYYRVALAQRSLEESAAAVSAAEAALEVSKEQVVMYQDILSRVNSSAGKEE
jgi:hypothetical protein